MTLQELIHEFTDCHDKQRLNYLRSEIERHTTEHVMRCYDISEASKKGKDIGIKMLRCDTPLPQSEINTMISRYRDLTGNEMAIMSR